MNVEFLFSRDLYRLLRPIFGVHPERVVTGMTVELGGRGDLVVVSFKEFIRDEKRGSCVTAGEPDFSLLRRLIAVAEADKELIPALDKLFPFREEEGRDDQTQTR